MTRRTGHALRRLGGALALALLACAAAGCNIIGPIYAIAHGPEKRPAAYTLDPTKKTVIFIDDRASHLPRRSLINVMGTAGEEALIAQEAVEPDNMIAAVSTQRAAAGEKYGELMSVTDIGRAVGADIVIYASVDTFLLSVDGVTIQPFGRVFVKVISVDEDRRLWPDTMQGREVRVALPHGGPAPSERSKLAQIEIALAQTMGLRISQLFYAHEPDNLEDRRDAP